jgi:hypothetical protein
MPLSHQLAKLNEQKLANPSSATDWDGRRRHENKLYKVWAFEWQQGQVAYLHYRDAREKLL